ncbi:peptide chain release factor N(5)-glutamine methyltransferase [Microbacterium sp. M3]|uniref:Release factor glutamine methyltransferase n=1 Tax=Microbacterium arthrosphaerae TaxID=792652 RepID=A0ABU4H1L6_9MICO|nr:MULTISPECIES: peptide chain release factor N(5)-glutamine methyltransferase [Microbacterium]MDW4573221.1 peptide chain release factor N(5)-glutamine methyltransferase [Microbacterium arthrosphaerae]MDW7607076.1 peptide chain release factor N(5)-glutamine methyltransferase [Microbacterium sp. M3]
MASSDEPVPLSAALNRAAARLAAAGIGDPAVDAELLAGFVLGTGRGGVQAAAVRGERLTADDAGRLDELVARRATREPLQHITGTAPFRHLELRVGPGVFVPRPETEGVAQLAIDALRAAASPSPIAVDLGTGSGAIALAMATEVPHAQVYAAENSVDAFVWTKENFALVGAANATLAFIDLAAAFPELDGTVSVVASNPPYVPDAAIPRDPEVRFFDPPAALYGGEDGLDVVRVLSGVGLRLAHPGGTIVIEHGEWQGEAIRAILAADGWLAAATHPDLTMRDRATTAIRP